MIFGGPRPSNLVKYVDLTHIKPTMNSTEIHHNLPRLCSGGELQQRWETEAYEEQDVIEVTHVSSGLLQRADAVTTGATC